ncbi:TPA: nuclear transport factor 2 family protein [Legionella pneumophila]|uniref:nuclear transport factor 2 family protein n=1 Tax=Legionella pneumophila TaxID=446 RepID=UPI0013750B97|nr:nuclear transport factor 2 family protein [Legionella pneumophila]HAT8751295.1 nuclear transport factor 2 family protein [Legionella pneumophila]
MYIQKLKEMFAQMVIKKNANLIPEYYHEEFLLYTNDIVTGYDEFLSSHLQYYATEIQYQVEYDEETFLEQGEKIAGRVFITTTRPNEPAKRIEVILIAQYKDEKIYRLWELTYPDWSKLPAFSNQLT